MKKRYLLCIIMAFLLLLSACSETDETPMTEPVTELMTEAVTEPETAPKHVCENTCDACGACFNGLCEEDACAVKCAGGHKEEPYSFPVDYITTSEISVDTGTLVFDIGENVYMPGNLTEQAETLVAVLEKVSGLDFDGAGYARQAFPDGKVHVKVSRDMLYSGDSEFRTWQTAEVGNAYASVGCHVEMSPGDLFMGSSYALVHELGHMLMYRQSEWHHSQLLNEGFAEYTTYLVLQELEQTEPEIAFALARSTYCVYNMDIYDYEKLYEQPLEYWFENTFEYSGNGNYAVGFRFMDYLRDVYGDYSKWITAFEDAYPYREITGDSDKSSVERQIEILKATYGEDVLDGFYPWLQEHLDRFDEMMYLRDFTDRTAAEGVNWYPDYNGIFSAVRMENIKYQDLYINLESARKYLGEYKREDTSELALLTSRAVEVRLYKADGTYTTVQTKAWYNYSWDWSKMTDSAKVIEEFGTPLDGISYIRLVGAGELECMEIAGAFRTVK